MLMVAKDEDTEIHRHNVKFHCQLLIKLEKSEALVELMSIIQGNPN